jgi:hypothetical protein
MYLFKLMKQTENSGNPRSQTSTRCVVSMDAPVKRFTVLGKDEDG